jgi:hypothetical protein
LFTQSTGRGAYILLWIALSSPHHIRQEEALGVETISTVLPIVRSRKGRLEPGVPQAFKNAAEARRRAERLAQHKEGVLLFEQTGDAEFNEYSDPKVVATYGSVPADVLAKVVPISF